MSRLRDRVLVVAGVVATAGGLWIAATWPDASASAEPGGLVKTLAVVGLLVAAYVLYDVARSGPSEDPVPWSDAGPIVEDRPEAHPPSPALAGRQFAETISAASETARDERRILSGIAVVREPLREAYLEAMDAAGVDRETAERDLAEGTWTDDVIAAAVLSAHVPLPPRPLRRRIADWLFPGRAVRRMTRRGVDAVAEAGDDRIPPVVGQDAPRNVPVYRPSLASLRRGPGGELVVPGESQREPPDAEGPIREPAGRDRAQTRGGQTPSGGGPPTDGVAPGEGTPSDGERSATDGEQSATDGEVWST